MQIDGKLVFVIYKPLAFQDVSKFIELWNDLARKNGLNGFYFICFTFNADKEGEQILKLGFDAIDSCRFCKKITIYTTSRCMIPVGNYCRKIIVTITL